MTMDELRKLEVSGLKKELLEILKEQFNLRMQLGTGQLPQVHLLKNARRRIARIKTVIREKESNQK